MQAEEEVLDVGLGLQIRCHCVLREHRNVLRHTGLMRWESSLALARLLISCPSLVSSKYPRQLLDISCDIQKQLWPRASCRRACTLTDNTSRPVLQTQQLSGMWSAAAHHAFALYHILGHKKPACFGCIVARLQGELAKV